MAFSSDNKVMVDGKMLSDMSKEELIKIIKDLYKEVEGLKQKVKEEQQKRNEKFVKPNAAKKRRMRPGQKFGHVGMTRPVPDHIDEIFEQTLCECPQCHHPLNESVEVLEQIQEDIVPAHVHVRKYRRHRYYCSCCQKMVTAPYHPQQVPRGYLGANVLIQAAILKYHHCLPYEKIADLLKDMAGLTVSPGGLSQALARVSDWLGVEKKVLLTAIRGSPQVHADETGWRLDGKKGWVWAFVNERLAYYEVNRSRGRRVVRNVLTDSFKGVLITDFYGVYFNLPYKKQKCLVHLLREFHDCAKRDISEEYQLNYKKIKRLINDALRLRDRREKLSKMVYLRRVVDIKQRLFDFMMSPYENKNLQRLSKRFNKFWLDMFTFLQDPAVAWNNNLAERMIRPNVIYRNRSFGNRSDRGAKAHGTLMSLIQTMRLQKKNAGEFLRTAFLTHRQGDLTSHLASILLTN
jgi:transposase